MSTRVTLDSLLAEMIDRALEGEVSLKPEWLRAL